MYCCAQTENLLKEYRTRIQELETEVQQYHQAKARSGTAVRPHYSLPSQVDKGSASGAILRLPGVDGDTSVPGAGPPSHIFLQFLAGLVGLSAELGDALNNPCTKEIFLYPSFMFVPSQLMFI